LGFYFGGKLQLGFYFCGKQHPGFHFGGKLQPVSLKTGLQMHLITNLVKCKSTAHKNVGS